MNPKQSITFLNNSVTIDSTIKKNIEKSEVHFSMYFHLSSLQIMEKNNEGCCSKY